jgi:hypothetical protein
MIVEIEQTIARVLIDCYLKDLVRFGMAGILRPTTPLRGVASEAAGVNQDEINLATAARS